MKRDARIKEERLPIGTKIYLNDVLVRECVVIDTDEGYIERWQTDTNGNVRLFYGDDGEPEPRLGSREYGAIRIELPAAN